jgi:hypothetical protein
MVRLSGPGGIPLAPMTLAGRASAGGPVDDVTAACVVDRFLE